jgi:periplasmic divalent cation tolerance protein
MSEVRLQSGDVVIAMTTVGSVDQAQSLARDLVSGRLAACVTSIPGVRSVYAWGGAVHEEEEILLLIKTPAERLGDLEDHLMRRHPYDLPEFLAVPVGHGSHRYLEWLREATRPGNTEER